MSKIIAMIPARMGSERLKCKNLRLLNGKSLISHVIDAAAKAEVFDKIVVNSEDELFSKIAERHGVDFYNRPHHLGSSETRADEVVYDFLLNNPCDVVVWVNPVSPLQQSDEINNAVRYMLEGDYDSLITVKKEYLHSIFKGKPLNFNSNEPFSKTQDLEPATSLVYSLMMWKSDPFVSTYEEKGFAMLSGKIGYYPVRKESTILVKYEEDFNLCEAVIKSRGAENIEYDSILDD
jgi:CMP-N-acetylneuraminic acid synthetase